MNTVDLRFTCTATVFVRMQERLRHHMRKRPDHRPV